MNIPASLRFFLRPTPSDAQYVAMTGPAQHTVWNFNPSLNYRETLEFATRNQCLDLISLIKSAASDPNQVNLTITDIGENRILPPFYQFKYFNTNPDGSVGVDTLRIYQISGTVNGKQTVIDVGWFIQAQLQMFMPQATGLALVEQFGGIFPQWTAPTQ